MHLALHLLGRPNLFLDDTPIAVDRRKVLALLAYLAVNRGNHSRDSLSALLWPEYAQAKAFTNLRHALWETGKLIGAGWIAAGRDSVGLIPAAGRDLWLDVAHFRSLVDESRAQNEVSLRLPLLTGSVNLYRGHFLTGFSLKDAPAFNEWASAESETLRRQLAGVLSRLAEDHCSLGQAETAIPYSQSLIALDPLNEASHCRLMQVYLQAGQHNAALKQYRTCEQILRRELEVDPRPETRALYQQIRRGKFTAPAPVSRRDAESAPRHNLPFQISTFIGREQERQEIARLMADHRLVTLTGTGGIGKTRLSMKLGEQLLNDFPDGVWLVELASLSDPGRVPQIVAALFGLIEEAGVSTVEKLMRALRPKSMLLIFDNCEHLLEACAQLAGTLLGNCPDLKLLATSREALGLAGEALYRVPSLALPEARQFLENLLEYESIRLFEERARLVQDDFSLTMENAASVARICQRLDGIPLAIELAAARVNVFSTEQISTRLNDSFNILTAGRRAALSRHHTLRASIDWSWKLLSDSEQALLRRLAVFPGGWTLEGAAAVSGGLQELDVLDLLANLVDKSLVSPGGGRERFQMLETVREYALEQLAAAGEEESTRNRQLDFYVEMAGLAEPGLLGREQGLWMKKLGDEQENIIAASEWCRRSEARHAQGFRLLGGIRYYWVYAGLAKLGFGMYRAALAGNRQDQTTLEVGLTHDGAAIYAVLLGDPLLAWHVEQSISIFQTLGDSVRLAMALTRKAVLQVNLGDHAEAIRIYHQALAIGRGLEDKRPVSSALNNLAELYRMDENYDQAASLYEEALAIDRERQDSTGIVLGLANGSRNALMQGRLDSVRAQLAEAVRVADEAHVREYVQTAIEATAVLRFELGQRLEGARLFGSADAELKKKGHKPDPPDEKFTLYWSARMRETLGEETFQAAAAEGAATSFEEAVADARKWLEAGV